MEEVLTCKFCAVEIDVLTSGRKPWDRVNKHLKTKQHQSMKADHEKRWKTADDI